MTKNPDCASPPCFAREMDEAYAGFLPKDELATTLKHLAALAEQAPEGTRKRWGPVLNSIVELLPAPRRSENALQASVNDAAEALCNEVRALLPQIADDRVRAALEQLLEPIK